MNQINTLHGHIQTAAMQMDLTTSHLCSQSDPFDDILTDFPENPGNIILTHQCHH